MSKTLSQHTRYRLCESYSIAQANTKSYKFEISVIVCSYNSAIDKVKKTLISILTQKDIHFEVVLADDGSDEFDFDEVRTLFDEFNFKNVKFVFNKVNKGTVINYLSGLKVAEGEFAKGISPGDQFYDDCTLKNWLSFMKEKKLEWSFSDAIYYINHDGKNINISVPAHPQDIKPYIKGNNEVARWNYIVLSDIALGAAIFGKTALQLYYCNIIKNVVIYAEDNIFRLMMFDGIVGQYYPKITIRYEYGTGVSTSKNKKWSLLLGNDCKNTNDIMLKTKNLDSFQQRMLEKMNNCNSLIEKLTTQGKLWFFIRKRFFTRMTSSD